MDRFILPGLAECLTSEELKAVHQEARRIKDRRRESQPITVRRFYHPNASYTQPLPTHYVNDIIWSKAEFLDLDWVKKFTANYEIETEEGKRFTFEKMEVTIDDAYLDFDDLTIKCGCFAVFKAYLTTSSVYGPMYDTDRRFIGFAENQFSTDKFFEWFATTEEQNKWKVKRQILKARLADAANERLKNLHPDQNNKTPIRKEILERKFEPGGSFMMKG